MLLTIKIFKYQVDAQLSNDYPARYQAGASETNGMKAQSAKNMM